jgi:oligopeptidase B
MSYSTVTLHPLEVESPGNFDDYDNDDEYREDDMGMVPITVNPRRRRLIYWTIGIVGVVIPLAILIFGSDPAFATFPFWKGLASRGIGKNLSDGSQPLDHSLPPYAKREEERVFYAGVAPPFWDTSFPRQAETSQEPMMDPPIAVSDPYGWMRDESRKDRQVLRHLKMENDYTENLTQHLEALRDEIYPELLNGITETDYTLPRPHGQYYYYRRTMEGLSYPIHCRAPLASTPHDQLRATLDLWTTDGDTSLPILPGEQVVLDENILCHEQSYCHVASLKISPSHELVAFSVDYAGGETYQIVIHSVATQKDVHVFTDHNSQDISSELEWGADDTTIYYLLMDAAQRPYQLYRKEWNALNAQDTLVFQESDVLFWLGMVPSSLEREYMLIATESTETSEWWYLNLNLDQTNSNDDEPKCIAPRTPGVRYDVEYRNQEWWIATNVNGTPNMQLFRAQIGKSTIPVLAELFDGSNDVAVVSVTPLANHVVVEGRQDGIPRIWILTLTDEEDYIPDHARLEFSEPAHDVELAGQYETNTTTIVVAYTSLVTPTQYIEIDLNEPSHRTILKERHVPGYTPENYGCSRITIPSRDGHTEIPVSLVYALDVWEARLYRPVHVHLYAYATYGVSIDDYFSSDRLALLDRRVIYAIAHVRGGGEMGRQWYEDGKYLAKKNTFNDLIDIAEWMIHEQWTTPALLSAEGRSAGGLTIAATINQAPELFKMAILGVPFCDLLATMVDSSVPLTAGEWEEWGNPNEIKYFEYMKSYAPLENVQNVTYPSMLLLAGLNDPRVQYWEPAKFAATLRYEQHPSSGPVLLRTDMASGHFSASDRYNYLKKKAFDYAFLLDQVGLA